MKRNRTKNRKVLVCVSRTYTISRTHTSGFGTMGAAFLYLDALKRHAIFGYLIRFSARINGSICGE